MKATVYLKVPLFETRYILLYQTPVLLTTSALDVLVIARNREGLIFKLNPVLVSLCLILIGCPVLVRTLLDDPLDPGSTLARCLVFGTPWFLVYHDSWLTCWCSAGMNRHGIPLKEAPNRGWCFLVIPFLIPGLSNQQVLHGLVCFGNPSYPSSWCDRECGNEPNPVPLKEPTSWTFFGGSCHFIPCISRAPASDQIRQTSKWAWLKIKDLGLRRFWSMFPLTRVPFWYRFFEPQPSNDHSLPDHQPFQTERCTKSCRCRAPSTACGAHKWPPECQGSICVAAKTWRCPRLFGVFLVLFIETKRQPLIEKRPQSEQPLPFA